MPQSMNLTTPPQLAAGKRQRSPGRLTNAPKAPSSEPSTLPNLDDSAVINVRIPPYLNKSRAKIAQSFQELEWKQRYRLQHGLSHPQTSPFRLDRSSPVSSRNRYGNIQPWEISRVKLKKPMGGSDYVNASPILLKTREGKKSSSGTSSPASNGQAPSDSRDSIRSRYIATQGPKEGQFSHFWHMVMQETIGDVGVIIQLTQHYEGNKEKCGLYYPVDLANPTMTIPAHEDGEDEGEPGPEDDGDPFLDSPAKSADADSSCPDSEKSQTSDLSNKAQDAAAEEQAGMVTLLSSDYDAKVGCQVRVLALIINDECKTIHHFLYDKWPDFGKPEADAKVALLELTRASKTLAGDSPRIVHCSAGVGRTGTWIALDFLIQELEAGHLAASPPPAAPAPSPSDSESQTATTSQATWGRSGPPKASTPDPAKDEEDIIWDTVNTLREQRMMMVMNELQYQFLYEVLREAFIEKYAEKETGPVVIEVQEPSPKVARRKSPIKDGGEKGEEGSVSEAETEIMEKDEGKNAGTEDVDMESQPTEADPYAAVAPDTIREGIAKDKRVRERDHENK